MNPQRFCVRFHQPELSSHNLMRCTRISPSNLTDMRALVQAVCRTATARFGEQVQLSLEVYRDPEIQDEYLTLYVRQETYDEQLPNTIDEVSAACESLLVNTSGWLLVTTDFCSPS